METNSQPVKRAYAIYHVGLKVLLKKGDEFLFLTDAVGKHFDLPGGRIDDVERMTPLTEVIAREVGEEFGEEVKYKLGKLVFNFADISRARVCIFFLRFTKQNICLAKLNCLPSIAVSSG